MSAPRLARDLVDRPRLIARLDERAPITVLRAPVGFGKTTLVTQWAHARAASEETVAWVRARSGAGPGSFWIEVVDAFAEVGLPLPASSAHRTPQAMAERMALSAKRPLTLVVDCFENVGGSGVDEALLELVWRVDQLRLIVCLRDQRQFRAARLAELDAVEITAQDLLFTADEIAQLFTAIDPDLPESSAAAARQQCGGWPEPTRMFALALRNRPGRRRGSDFAELGRQVAVEYLRQRLLPTVTRPDFVELALITALPDQFTAELAVHLSANDAAPMYLRWLEDQGVLLVHGDGTADKPIYRWPEAARAALQVELQQRMSDRLPQLWSRLARWHLRGNDPGTALEFATRAGDWRLAVDVIERNWRTLVYRHRDEVYRALVRLPLETILRSRRAIALRDLWLQMPDDGLLTEAPLPESTSELAELGRCANAADILDEELAVLIALRRRGMFDHARTHADRLLQVAAAARVARTSEVVTLLPSVHLHAGLTRILGGDLGAALEPLQLAYRFADDSPLDYIAADASASMALAYALTGEIRNAETWLGRFAAAPSPSTWLASQINAKWIAARLCAATAGLDLDAAYEADDELVQDLEAVEFWAHILYTRLQFAIHAGTVGDALEMLDRDRTRFAHWLGHGAAARPMLAAAEVDLLIALGHGNQARQVLDAPGADHPFLHVPRARLALLTGNDSDAARLATDAVWARTATARQRMDILLIHAVAAHRLGDPATAAAALTRAVDAAQTTGALRSFLTVPRDELAAVAADVPSAREILDGPALARHAGLFPPAIKLIQLTSREQTVLERLAAGLTLQQAADALVVSYNTIKTQQRSIYRKLGTESRADAIARAREWGLLRTTH